MGWLGAIEMERQNFKERGTVDWGCFIGATKGFSTHEGSKEDVINATLNFIPYFRFQIFEVANIDELEDAIKNM